MNELTDQLKDKAGLTDEQAIKAIQVMKEYIYSKVPPMFSGFVDQFLTGNVANEADPLSQH